LLTLIGQEVIGQRPESLRGLAVETHDTLVHRGHSDHRLHPVNCINHIRRLINHRHAVVFLGQDITGQGRDLTLRKTGPGRDPTLRKRGQGRDLTL